MKKVLPMEKTLRNLDGEKRVIRRIRPFRVKISPLGLRDFKESDESITYRRKDTVWYKAHPKAEPEILVYKGLHILNYHKFVSDAELEGRQYRLFYNPVAKRFFANEIVSVDGNTYLKNPSCDENLVKELLECVNSTAAPESKKLNSINKFVKDWKKQKLKNKPKLKHRGRKEEDYLKRATLWAIENKLRREKRTETARRAYEIFKGEAQSETAFIKSVRNKWTSLNAIYKGKHPIEKDENGKFKKRVSFKLFVRNHFKLP